MAAAAGPTPSPPNPSPPGGGTPPPRGRWASIFSNIFEHTIARSEQINAFPRDADGIKWPSFYREPITDANGDLNYKALAKKAAIVFGCFALLSLIGTAIIFSGGAPLVGGIGVLIGATIAGSVTLPALPFAVSVFFRSVAKATWTLVAGPVHDLLDNLFRKLPVALFGGFLKRTASTIKNKFGKDEEIESNVPVRAQKQVTAGLAFTVIQKPDGTVVYSPNRPLDKMANSELRALVRSVATYHKKNFQKAQFSIDMHYSSVQKQTFDKNADKQTINREMADIKKRATPVLVGASGDVKSFTVEEDPEGKRIYKPHKNWTELDPQEKEALLKNIFSYENQKSKQVTDKGLGGHIDIGNDPNVTATDDTELGALYAQVKASMSVSPAAAPAASSASTPASSPSVSAAPPVSGQPVAPAVQSAAPAVATPASSAVQPQPSVQSTVAAQQAAIVSVVSPGPASAPSAVQPVPQPAAQPVAAAPPVLPPMPASELPPPPPGTPPPPQLAKDALLFPVPAEYTVHRHEGPKDRTEQSPDSQKATLPSKKRPT